MQWQWSRLKVHLIWPLHGVVKSEWLFSSGSNGLTVSLCPQRVVGSIRGSYMNTVSPSSLPPRFTGFQPFLFPPLPLNLYFSVSLSIYCTAAALSTSIFPPLMRVIILLHRPSPLAPWLPLVLLLLVVFINPLTSILVFTFFFCFAISSSIFASVSISLSLPYLSISIHFPLFFSSFPLIGRQMLTLAY